jgi:hypothetical protein
MKWIKKLFSCPPDRNLILVWREETDILGSRQVHTDTKVMLGRHTVLCWTTIYSPVDRDQ